MLRLRQLSNSEYELAERLANKTPIPLDTCPTCSSKQNNGEWEGVQTYKLRGKVYKCDCQAQYTLRMHYLIASLPAGYFTLHFPTDYTRSDAVQGAISSYLSAWKNASRMGLGLLFRSEGLGTAKTFAAVHVGKELIKLKQDVFFTDFREMIQKEDRIREENTPFLIVDEVRLPWTDKSTPIFSDRFEEVIRYRNHHALPTILTTNMTQFQLEETYPRVASLLTPSTVEIDMPGGDYRNNNYAMERLSLLANNEVKPIV